MTESLMTLGWVLLFTLVVSVLAFAVIWALVGR